MGFIEWLFECLKDFTVRMDWKQFVPSLIATFVGIFVPFWVQSGREKKQHRKDALLKVEQIITELNKVKEDILSISPTSLNINPLKTPIGDSLLNSNEMQLLADLQRYYLKKSEKRGNKTGIREDIDWYKLIFEVYSVLSEYNHWWNLYTEHFVSISSSEKDRWQKEQSITPEQVLKFIEGSFDLSLIKKNLDYTKDALCADEQNERSIAYVIAVLKSVKEQ